MGWTISNSGVVIGMDGWPIASKPWLWYAWNLCRATISYNCLAPTSDWFEQESCVLAIRLILDGYNQKKIATWSHQRYDAGYRTASFDRDFCQSTMDFLTAPGFLHLVTQLVFSGNWMVRFKPYHALHQIHWVSHRPIASGYASGWSWGWRQIVWWCWHQIALHGAFPLEGQAYGISWM